MKTLAKRFTIPRGLLREAERYAVMDHRSFSELVCEALRQHMARYPKKGKDRQEKSLTDRIRALEGIVRQKYPQVP